MSALSTIQASWDRAAVKDAMFNIITEPGRQDGGWTIEEFFEHGRREITAAMDRLRSLGLAHGERALDFGCGIGRLTKALTGYCKYVDGVDVSGSMISHAHVVKCVGPGRPRYFHNPFPDLKLFQDDTYDLVYSMVVLQHMPQHLQRGYMAEFFRVLKPGGIAMIHVPDGPDSGGEGWHLSMYGVPRDTVEEWIGDAGGTLVDVEDLGMDAAWRNLRYTAVAS